MGEMEMRGAVLGFACAAAAVAGATPAGLTTGTGETPGAFGVASIAAHGPFGTSDSPFAAANA